ncbi:MraY family glycosyltransferase [Patulibacter sp. SYSU D01012]|uniref:glycosyltransferase family 4 protein n=1 Tax=Patulibacter sp. SYSU D01012 TaxID=2817381 RepID=UPI001B30084F|nr:MraY family glycosyltransferase [Patulibacter sp. SYSU D01012]
MTWRDPVVGLLVAFAVAAVATPLVARFARLVGAVDRPRGRGLAAGGTPLLGGLAILAAVGVTVLLLRLPPSWAGFQSELDAVLLGGVVIAVVGAIDDRFDLPWLVKLAGQIVAAAIPVSQHVVVENITFPFLGAVQFHDFGAPLTVLGFVALMNVVNFSDGIDGLAAGVSAIAAVAMGIVAWNLGTTHASLLAGATAGAAAGFLVHNFHPARVFMGDAGALLLGYLLAAVAVEGSVKTNAVLALVVPFVVLALPMLDTTFVVLKRLKSGVPIYNADQNHFHHRLTRIGFSPRRTVLYLYAWAASLAGLAVALGFVPYSPNREGYSPAWTAVMVVITLAVLSFSVYLVLVLEILKLRRLDALRMRRIRPHATDAEIDSHVARSLETGEIDAITEDELTTSAADPAARP